MIYKNFNDLVKKVRQTKEPKKVAVVAAQDENVLKGVFRAKEDNIVVPFLIGNKHEIIKITKSIGGNLDKDMIFDTADDKSSAVKAVELVRSGDVDLIMKGKIQTADLLREVVDKERGLRTGRIMSHMVLHEIPNYSKLLTVTDGGMAMYPTLPEKRQIIENAVEALIKMGYQKPKVAVLAAVEKVNSNMPESVDADALKKMYITGEIKDCIIEGPISYDLTMSEKSAKIKGYKSPIVGDADILLVPNITTGNILGKCLQYSAGAKMAGFVVGARVPIVLTSRGETSEEKYLSLVISAAAVY